MKCPECQAENLADAVFCEACSAPLEAACPICGAGNRPTAKFCRKCGGSLAAAPAVGRDPRAYTPKHLADKILQAKSALEGERKQVTVLFADVKGSLELAAQLDPEAWHQILDRFFQILTDGVHRFEGTVNQYTGDGIMALFGAPIAHEDHAQRACHAALHLRETLCAYADELRRAQGVNFATRIGVNSGEVIVGSIGDDLRMDYTAQGHTVGLAQRMESLAEPNSCYMTAATAALVGGYFVLEDLGEMPVKGIVAPVRVHRLAGIGASRAHFDIARARGLSSFVGRAADLRTLQDALAQAAAGNGQVVGVVAEAGTGKSRLCFEFLEHCRGRGLQVFEGRAVAHGRNIPLLPILEVFRAYFGLTHGNDDRAARTKIAGCLAVLDQRFAAALPLVCEFLGVGDLSHPAPRLDPEVRQRQLLDVMRHVTAQASGRQPTVTMIEDLHWLDPASAEFLEHMVEAQAGSRNLLLVNFRPEYRAEWMQKSWYRQIPLTPLAREAVAELLGDLLGHDPSINTLADLIHARTGGNPFFTEEVAQSLIESGNLEGARGACRLVTPIERLEVPATVQAVLAARIDRLPEREKRLLQIASVIGKDFPEPLLAAVATLPVVEMKSSLAALRRAEFIYEQALFPVLEYAFKHPLTQEVALGSQLKERRQRLHAAVARAIEQQNAERLDERAALLAQHWEDAGNALEAARWHRRAAHRTEDTDPSESLRRWHKVRALLADAAVSPEMTALRIRACRGILSALWRVGGTEVDSVFAEGKALAEQAGDLRSLAMFFTLYGNAKGAAGDLRAYRAHASEALRLAELTGDLVLQAAISSDAGHPFGWTGRLREAVQLAEKGIALGPEDLSLGQDLFGVGAYLLGLLFRGAALVEMGRFDEAASDLDRAGQYPAAEPSAFIWSQMFHAVRAYRAGDAPGALTHARRALERAEESGVPILLILAQVALGIALVANREWRGVEKAGLRALALAREHGVGFGMTARALFFLAEAKLGQGDPHAALALADEALVDARQSGGRLFEMDALLTRARAVLSAEGASGAAEVARTLAAASALIDETGARCGEPIVHEVSAELARVCGDEGSRERELYAAHRLFAEMGATGHAERVAQLLAESPR